MAAPFGGQFLFDVPSGAATVNLGLTDDGTRPPFPGTVPGALNIEAFTSVTGNTLPALAPGFTVGVIASDTVAGDAPPKVVNGFLTGRQLRLFGGNYRVTDSVTGSAQQTVDQIIAGSGNQTLVGAAGDTIIGGSGDTQFLDASNGGQQVTLGGGNNFTVIGGRNDTILGNSTSSTNVSSGQIVGTAGAMSIDLPGRGSYTITSGIGDSITGFGQSVAVTGAEGDLIDFSRDLVGSNNTTVNAAAGAAPGDGETIVLGRSNYTIIGGAFDTIEGGAGTAQIIGVPSMFINLPAEGKETITSAIGDTIAGPPGKSFSSTVLIAGAKGDSIDMGFGASGVVIGANSTLLGAASTVPGSGDIIRAGGGSVTLIGGSFDTLFGASQALLGGAGRSQIVATQGSMLIVVDPFGNTTISSGGNDTITSASSNPFVPGNLAMTAGKGDRIDLTGFAAPAVITGAAGDTITAGNSGTTINGSAGTMAIALGNFLNITGSTASGAGDTITGGSGQPGFGNLNYNPGATGTSVSGGDLINLSGSPGNATVNAFSSGATQFALVNDTVLAGNGADSVWGGGGGRIGVGSVAGGSTVNPGGTHLWDHSTTVPGAPIAFGTNDTVAPTTYDTVKGTATRNPTVAGSSSATVTVTNFQTATDSIFYPNESVLTTSQIVATAAATTVGGAASTMITLPDGTVMTLVGVAAVTPLLFKP